jgi:hypothetical protein
MNQGNRRDWREICEEVLHETDQDRLNSLLQELLDALEDRERFRGQGTSASLRD